MALLNIEEPGQTALPHQEEEIAIGIDLGTTNSLAAIKEGDQLTIIPDANGNVIQPSIVAFDDSGAIFCGHQTKESKNSTKIHSIKRLMDENSLKNPQNQQILENFPHKIVKNEQNPLKVKIGGQELTPTEISSYLLKYLKEIAQNYLKKPVRKAVITVPAYFDEAARNATRNAAILADLEVMRLINEPTAAAIAYGLDNDAQGNFVVFDLGGGTFDVSILKLHNGVFKVIGVAGDSAMGGDDIDYLLVDAIIQNCQIANINLEQRHKIKLIAKDIKEELASKDLVKKEFTLAKKHQFSLSKIEFAKIINHFVQKTIKITQDLIDDLDLESENIKGIVLVGGSTRTLLIREELAKNFGQNKILTNLDPDKIVAIGAAIQAHGLTHGSSNLLLDVVPLSLGIETMGGIVEKIIERNSTIPTSYSKEFTTYKDGQSGMKLNIVQGERELASDCRSLAKFEIKNIPALKAGVARVKVTFTIDADGLLTVSAKETNTGQIQKIEVKPAFGLDEIKIKEILINSAKNAQEDITKRLLIEAQSEANRNILAIKAALKEGGELLTKPQINAIQNQISILAKAIKKSVKEQIDMEAEKLEDLAKDFAEIKMNKYIKKALVNKKI